MKNFMLRIALLTFTLDVLHKALEHIKEKHPKIYAEAIISGILENKEQFEALKELTEKCPRL